MFLREMYVLKERELNLQQAALTADLQNHNPDPLSEVTRVASIGTQLRIHAAQSHQLVQRLCWALYFGVGQTPRVNSLIKSHNVHMCSVAKCV